MNNDSQVSDLKNYFRPLVQCDPARPDGAVRLAGGWCWFEKVEHVRRGKPSRILPVDQLPLDVRKRLEQPRAPIAGVAMDNPRLMGILNVTPDSFSDGGKHVAVTSAAAHAQEMIAAGADIIDIGGESTRPGAEEVPVEEETARIEPVVRAIAGSTGVPLSIDTRKSAVARPAIAAGAAVVNDVSAMKFDSQMADYIAETELPICLMHARGTPANMQDDPRYDNVLLDVYDWLAERVDAAVDAGIRRENIIVDPGIGFGKTLEQNLALLRGIALFHGLGCPILLGASRKRFIGTLSGEEDPARRAPGSVAVALAGFAKGVQIARVHDVRETRQALTLWQAANGMGQ